MHHRVLGSVLAAVALGCGPPPPPPAPPPPPPPSAPSTGPEARCAPEGPFRPLPAETEIYDDLDPTGQHVDPYAEDDPYDPDDPQAAAKHAFTVGKKAAMEERWGDAYHAFLESWTLRKSLSYADALAQTCARLDRPRETLYYAGFILGLSSIQHKPAARAQATELYENAMKLVAKIAVKTEDGACVRIDGLVAGLSPLSAALVNPGHHRVEAWHAGRRGAGELEILAGGSGEVAVDLK